VRQIAKELGVRYVLEGRIRHAGQRLRIMAKLADAETGKHLWSERYDPELEDIFAIQDEVSDAIVREIAPEIGQVELIRAQRKPPENLGAWGLYQRGLAKYPSGAKDDFEAAIVSFDRAVDLDPLFADAHAMAALTRLRLIYYFRPHNSDALIERARDLALGAIRLDPRNAICHSAMGRLHNIMGEHGEALAACRQAVNLNPNSVVARSELASALASLENWSEAIDHFAFMQKLSPMDPHISASFAGRAICLFCLGRYEESVEFALKASRSPNPRYWADATLVASLTLLGRNQEAMKAKKTLLDRKPDFSIAALAQMQRSLVSDMMINSLRQAGLPE
jgi:adenylate cyclase